ncbi:Receptor expression-enhancing protein 5 [Trichinella pseudospiralis]|uniref:Receptor expression-enhancing protein n=1 Tax=Trichinella pseudospiralis TaxID=6337 RepID=A0A0V1IN83_TRIPS|nr:Receptor expression-enhancing protein 5 [Trichinella pseudospiralis]
MSNSMMVRVENFRSMLGAKLREKNKLNAFLATLESKTGVDRIYIATGMFLFFCIYLIFGYLAQLLCNLAGFAYPAYASFFAVQSPDKKDDTHWLTYWVVFGFFNVIEFASGFLLSWFPIYYLAKFLLLLYLYIPATRGAEKLYEKAVIPTMARLNECMTKDVTIPDEKKGKKN